MTCNHVLLCCCLLFQCASALTYLCFISNLSTCLRLVHAGTCVCVHACACVCVCVSHVMCEKLGWLVLHMLPVVDEILCTSQTKSSQFICDQCNVELLVTSVQYCIDRQNDKVPTASARYYCAVGVLKWCLLMTEIIKSVCLEDSWY